MKVALCWANTSRRNSFPCQNPIGERTFTVSMALLLLSCVLLVADADAATNVSGAITEDTIWNVVNSPYRLVGHLAINSGVTLRIPSDVRFEKGGGWNTTTRGYTAAFDI